jgi:DNA modification methylase
MTNRASKKWAPVAPEGLSATIADKSRKRRQVQRALTEIGEHAPHKRRNDLAPLLHIVMTPTASLKPAARQVRRRDAAQNARLQASIDRFGICRPILIAADGVIVEGHGVWEVAKQKGIPEIPCIVVDHLDANERRRLPIALNRIAETGAWDVEALRVEFAELTLLGEDIVVTGFAMAEIDAVLLEDDEDPDDLEAEALALPWSVATSRAGDVWVLDDHRLIQGDARDPGVYARLMVEGETAVLVLTDVPFNVPNLGHVTGNAGHREFAMANGEMNPEQFGGFNRGWMSPAAAHVVDGGLIATFIDWRSVEIVLNCGRDLGFTLLNIVIWVKTNGGQGSLWRSQHEMLPVFKKGNGRHINNVELGRHGRWRSNVWTYPGASSLGSDSRDGLSVHPTVKPRALLEDALLDVTNRGDIVIDCFAGSGSTLLAAEAVGRRCRAIEIDGPYCDVIIRRWQEMTGRQAVLEATGEPFADVAVQRANKNESEPLAAAPTDRDRDPNMGAHDDGRE